MSWSKEDISFKKLSSKRVTWTSNQVFEEIGARSLDIHNLDIKTDPIPDVPPGTSTSVLQFYDYSGGTGLTLVKDLTVSDNLTYFATIFNSSGQEAFANQLVGAGATGRLFNFVSDKYDALGTAAGAGYEIKLYDKDGVQITKTDSSLWYFDYQTGILIFQNSASGTISGRAPFSITAYRYIGGFGITAGTGGTGAGFATTGIISINNLDSTSQTLSVGNSGIKFNLVSIGSSHTFNLPDAGIGITGLITGKAQTISGVKSLTDHLNLLSGKEVRFFDSTSSNYIGLKSSTPLTNLTFSLPDTDGTAGQVLKTDGSANLSWVDKNVSVGQTPPGSPAQGDLWWSTLDANLFIYYIDGTSAQWVEATSGANGGNYGGSGTGLTILNGLTFPVQTFEVGSLGLDFNISSAGSSHTFNIPSAGSTTRGLVSTSTQTFGGLKRFSNGLEIKTGSSLKLFNSGDTAYTALQSVATSSVTYTLPPDDGLPLQVLQTDGSAALGWTYAGDVYIDVNPPASPRTGTLWWNSYEGDLKIYYFDGTNSIWVDANNGGVGGGISGGSGISDINGLTALTQYFTTGTSGNSFNIVSSGSTHVFNIPLSGSATTGLVSPNAQTLYGVKSFDDGLEVLSSNTLSFYNSANSYSVAIQAASGTSSNTTYVLPLADGSNGYALKTDGSGNLFWDTVASGTASIGVSNILPLVGNTQGDLIWHTEEGTLKIWYVDTDTAQWVDASRNSFGGTGSGSATTAISSLNSLSEPLQTFSVGSTGTKFNIVSTGSSHTFNIPLSGNGVTGLIDSNSQTIYGAKTFDSDLYAVNNIYVSKDNYIGGVPSDFTVGGSTGVIYFGVAKGQNINRFAGMKVEEISSPLGGGNLNGEVVFYSDSESQDLSTERFRITGFGTVISKGPTVITATAGSATTSDGDLLVHGGIGVKGNVNASSVGVADISSIFSSYLLASTTTPNQVLHSLDSNAFRSAKYVIQVLSGVEVHALEILLIHDGADVFMTEYAQVLGSTNQILSTFDAQINISGYLELLVTPVNASTLYSCSCTALRV